MMKQIPEREDKLSQLKDIHQKQLQKTLKSINKKDIKDAYSIVHELHTSGANYFNEFERTLDEYSLPGIEISKDIINRKVEDTLNIIDTIFYHWNAVRMFCEKYSIEEIIPSSTSYATLQRIIKLFKPEIATEKRKEFIDNKLPTYGFDSKTEHSGWKRKNNIWPVLIPFLFAFVVIVACIGLLSIIVNPILFSVILIACLLFLLVIIGVILRMTGYLSETGYLRLIDTLIEKVPLLKNNVDVSKNKENLDD